MTQAKGATFTVNVMVTGGQNVYSVPVQLSYDPNQIAGRECFEWRLPVAGWPGGRAWYIATIPTTGTLQVTASRPPGVGGVSGQGAVVTLTFMAKSAGAVGA